MTLLLRVRYVVRSTPSFSLGLEHRVCEAPLDERVQLNHFGAF